MILYVLLNIMCMVYSMVFTLYIRGYYGFTIVSWWCSRYKYCSMVVPRNGYV